MTTLHIRPPGALTDVDTAQRTEPGNLWYDEATGLTHVYVYNAGAATLSAADAVGVFTTLARGHVSGTDGTMLEQTDGTTVTKACAGVAVSTIATTEFGWLVAKGFNPTGVVTTDGSVAIGSELAIKDATVTFKGGATAATAHVGGCGYGLAADVGTTLTGYILMDTYFV